jgi:hypothetical protein
MKLNHCIDCRKIISTIAIRCKSCSNKNRKGKYKIYKGFNIDNKNPAWKGDKVSYKSLHQWIQRKKGKAKMCEKCHSLRKVGWANKDHKYSRNLNDWIELCHVCHGKYDSELGIRKNSRGDKNFVDR